MDGTDEAVTSTLLETEYVVVTVWETDAEEDCECQLDDVLETKGLPEADPIELTVEISVAEYVWTDDAEIIEL